MLPGLSPKNYDKYADIEVVDAKSDFSQPHLFTTRKINFQFARNFRPQPKIHCASRQITSIADFINSTMAFTFQKGSEFGSTFYPPPTPDLTRPPPDWKPHKITDTLTRSNKDTWFLKVETYFKGKGSEWLFATTLREYAWIENSEIAHQLGFITDKELVDLRASQEELDKKYPLKKGSNRFPGCWNEGKKAQFEIEAAKVSYSLMEILDSYDLDAIKGLALRDGWAWLKAKYYKTTLASNRLAVKKVANWEKPNDKSLEESWIELKELGRQITRNQPVLLTTYTEEYLYDIFVAGLPKEYATIITVQDGQTNASIYEKFDQLEVTEARLVSESEGAAPTEPVDDKLHASVALFAGRFRRHFENNKRARSPALSGPGCYLCSEDHFIRNCPLLSQFQDFVRRFMEERDQPKRNSKRHDAKHSKKPSDKYAKNDQRASKHTRFAGDQGDRKPKGYHRGYNAEESSEREDSNDESDSDSYDEGFVSVDKSTAKGALSRGEIPASSWISDSGASTHMTDDPSLFRGPLIKIKRRRIRVGGGELSSAKKGTVELRVQDGGSTLLKDCLLVPNLGANLMSGRRIVQKGLDGRFNESEMYYTLGNTKIIRAKAQDGVYVVSYIAPGFTEAGFSATCLTIDDAFDAVEGESGDEDLTKKERDRYRIYHRRFGHIGPAKLRRLHLLTNLKKAIKIPKDRDICGPCKIGKLTNRRHKELSDWKEEPLELVQADICGPFPPSMRKYRYFIELIDHGTRRKWLLLLKTKGDAIPKLDKWKKQEEVAQRRTLRAFRTDNAGELKKIILQWAASSGLKEQHTIPHNSFMNGLPERGIRTTTANVRAMLEDANLPVEFWCEAAEASTYIRNRIDEGPIKNGEEVSCWEAYTGEVPDISHMRAWGSVCWMPVFKGSHMKGGRSDKLMATGRIGVFMGYSDTTDKHFKVYAPDRGYTITTHVVEVDETRKGGSIDIRLRSYAGSQGTQNTLPDRMPVGRPPAQNKPKRGVAQISAPVHQPPTLTAQDDEFESLPTTEPPADAESLTPLAASEPPTEPFDTSIIPDLSAHKHVYVDDDGSPLQGDTIVVDTSGDVAEMEREGSPDTVLDPRLETQDVPIPPTPPDPVPDAPETPYFFRHESREKRKRSDSQVEEDGRVRKLIRAHIARIEEEVEFHDIALDWEEYAYLCNSKRRFYPGTKVPIPKTYQEAISDPKYGKFWLQATGTEINGLNGNTTWEEEIAPDGTNLVSMKWVFTVKLTVDGTIDRFKARLVARGFSQVYGEDFTETFAPTVRADTLRVFFAIVAKENLECHGLDVKNAFTESLLEEKIFCSAPPGVAVKKGYSLRLLRALYGLKQSARCWNLAAKQALFEAGFVQSKADPCLFTHHKRNLMVLVYVDDMVFSAKKMDQITWFKEFIASKWNIVDLGECRKVLGMRVTRDRKSKTLYLDQETYVKNMCAKFGIPHARHNPKKAFPLNGYDGILPAKDDETRINVQEYQEICGSMMHAMVYTRPDIAFAVGKLAQFMSQPVERHGQAAKSLLRYLIATNHFKVRYGPGGDSRLCVFADSDWAGDPSDRKSTSGGAARLYDGFVAWVSKKQKSTSTSSTEAEYIAACLLAKLGQWLAQLLRDMGRPELVGENGSCVAMKGDNKGAIELIKNSILHERSKHIYIQYHYIRDLYELDRITIDYIPTQEMLADGLTKPLTGPTFGRWIGLIGLETEKH